MDFKVNKTKNKFHKKNNEIDNQINNKKNNEILKELKIAEDKLNFEKKELQIAEDKLIFEKKELEKEIKKLSNDKNVYSKNMYLDKINLDKILKKIDVMKQVINKYSNCSFYNCRFEIANNDLKTKKTLSFKQNCFEDFLPQNVDDNSLNLFKLASYDIGFTEKMKRAKTALKNLEYGNYKNPYLAMSLNNPINVGTDIVPKYFIPLNEKQQNAVKMAVNSTCISYLQGPPGTGKTQTISAVAQSEILTHNSNLLITSSTHEAINNFFDRLFDASVNDPNVIYLRMVPAENELRRKEAFKYSEKSMLFNFLNAMDNNIITSRIENNEKEEVSKLLRMSLRIDKKIISRIVYNKIFEIEGLNAKDLAGLVDANNVEMLSELKYLKVDLKERFDKFVDRNEDENIACFIKMFINVADMLISKKLSELKELLNPYIWIQNLANLNFEKNVSNFAGAITSLNKKLVFLQNDENFQNKNDVFANLAINENKINVIGLTTTAKQIIRVGNMEKELFVEYPIHYEIIDEVSKSTTIEIISTVMLSNKILLAGDYRQLPPQNEIGDELFKEFKVFLDDNLDIADFYKMPKDESQLKNIAKDLYLYSMFKENAMKLVVENNNSNRSYANLTVQHRFSEPIMNIVNLVYNEEEKLQMPDNQFHTLAPRKVVLDKQYESAVLLYDTSHLSQRFVDEFREKTRIHLERGMDAFDQKQTLDGKRDSMTRFNQFNAYEIAMLIANLLANNPTLNGDQIGVISMTRVQNKFIKEEMNKLINKNEIKRLDQIRHVKVDTVDNFQGREREVIIVDFVAANGFFSNRNSKIVTNMKRNLEYYEKAERFNVSVSRAKSTLILVGAVKDYLANNVVTTIDGVGGRGLQNIKLIDEQYRLIDRMGGVIES